MANPFERARQNRDSRRGDEREKRTAAQMTEAIKRDKAKADQDIFRGRIYDLFHKQNYLVQAIFEEIKAAGIECTWSTGIVPVQTSNLYTEVRRGKFEKNRDYPISYSESDSGDSAFGSKYTVEGIATLTLIPVTLSSETGFIIKKVQLHPDVMCTLQVGQSLNEKVLFFSSTPNFIEEIKAFLVQAIEQS